MSFNTPVSRHVGEEEEEEEEEGNGGLIEGERELERNSMHK